MIITIVEYLLCDHALYTLNLTAVVVFLPKPYSVVVINHLVTCNKNTRIRSKVYIVYM